MAAIWGPSFPQCPGPGPPSPNVSPSLTLVACGPVCSGGYWSADSLMCGWRRCACTSSIGQGCLSLSPCPATLASVPEGLPSPHSAAAPSSHRILRHRKGLSGDEGKEQFVYRGGGFRKGQN